MSDASFLNDRAYPSIRAQLGNAFIEHKADLGPAAEAASDEAILDRVDALTALLMRAVTKAMAQRNETFLCRYSWFIDLMCETFKPGKPLDS
jgi:hypothetical protein